MPKLADLQNQFCANIRDPNNGFEVKGVVADRMQVYQELIYNNVEDALHTVFPICQEILPADKWHALVRNFFIEHKAKKPLYRHISEEFLEFLLGLPIDKDFPFLQELAHFEWIELALDNDTHTLIINNIEATQDIANEIIQLSPLAWNLRYQYPVHEISQDCQPKKPSDEITFIIAYRNSDDEVLFEATDHFTHLILAACAENTTLTGYEILNTIAEQHQQEHQPVTVLGREIIQRLQKQDVLLIHKD